MGVLFSIIIPVYNVKCYISECIESVIRQTYKNYEIIIIDDGSTDGSSDICDMYGKKQANIKVYHQGNAGLSSARNAGITFATGNYLLFLDSDDFWGDEDYLMKLQYKISVKKEPDIIITTAYTRYMDGKTKKVVMSDVELKKINNLEYSVALGEIFSSDYFPVSAWSKAVKKEKIVAHSIFFEKDLLSEDIDWTLKLIKNCQTITFIQENNYMYRMRLDSITHSLKEKTYADLYYIIKKWSDILKKEEDSELKQSMLGYLSYEYFILLGIRRILGNFNKYFKELESLKWLLDYSCNSKTQKCGFLYKLFGLKGTSYLLAFYLKRKD